MRADLGVNRFQYALSSGREMYRMFNEKMRMSKQSILNWLTRGAELLEGGKKYIKKMLLKMGTSIYCDETWVWTKVKVNGVYKYVKRYMWVIVNLTTKVCYYLFGRRKRKVIEEFLGEFKGTLMTDAYNAYAYFSKITYRDIGSVLIDNNCCERAVRPFTNLRKSFGGFSSEKGGEVAAAWLTFIETCKLQKKAAFDFFNDFFKKVTEGRSNYELIAQEVLG